MRLVVDSQGTIRGVYAEAIDLSLLGEVAVRRASHVEPDEQGRWWAELALVGGPKLGPYGRRSDALAAELKWLEDHWLGEVRADSRRATSAPADGTDSKDLTTTPPEDRPWD